MDSSRINCKVCEKPYSDKKIPRSLRCGHSLCNGCLEIIILYSKLCPECGAKITVSNVSDLQVNYPLLSLVESFTKSLRINNLPPDQKRTRQTAAVDPTVPTPEQSIPRQKAAVDPAVPTPEQSIARQKAAVDPAVPTPEQSIPRQKAAVDPAVPTPEQSIPRQKAAVDPAVPTPEQSILRQKAAVDPAVPTPEQSIPRQKAAVNPTVPTPSGPLASEVQESEKCKAHDSTEGFMCITCQVGICQECMTKDHQEPPRGNCRITSTKAGLIEMKSSHRLSISVIRHPNKVKGLREWLNSDISIMDAKKNSFDARLQELLSQMNLIKDGLAELQPQKVKTVSRLANLEEITEWVERSDSMVNEAKSIQEFKASMEILAESISAFDEFENKEKEIRPVIQRTLLQGSQNLLMLLRSGKAVYATSGDNTNRRWSYLAYKENQILVHSLRDGKVPSDGIKIPFNSVPEMVPETTPSVFLDVSSRGQLRGRVFVRILGNKPRHRQVILLCSGEAGPSYRNTCFYRYSHMDKGLYNLLSGGDYENNNGTGGRSIVEGITDGETYKHQIVAGLMVGWPASDTWRSGSFDFYLNDVLHECDYGAIGIVTQGLHILQEVAATVPISNSCVTNCGLAIPVTL